MKFYHEKTLAVLGNNDQERDIIKKYNQINFYFKFKKNLLRNDDSEEPIISSIFKYLKKNFFLIIYKDNQESGDSKQLIDN